MKITMGSARIGALALTAILILPCAGCSRGLTIYNTSNHDVTFTQRLEGGERSYTLHPGAQMEMESGSRVNLGDYTIAAE